MRWLGSRNTGALRGALSRFFGGEEAVVVSGPSRHKLKETDTPDEVARMAAIQGKAWAGRMAVDAIPAVWFMENLSYVVAIVEAAQANEREACARAIERHGLREPGDAFAKTWQQRMDYASAIRARNGDPA